MIRQQCAGCDKWFNARNKDEIFCEDCRKEFDSCKQFLHNEQLRLPLED